MKKQDRLAAAVAAACASVTGWSFGVQASDTTLSEVVIRDKGAAGEPGSLRNEIVKTETISARSIEKSNASNLIEALDNHPGVSIQVECSVCNVRNVSLDNLPGRFTTVLMDGIPLQSSVSTAYGLDSISTKGVERIDIARGAGASLIAPEALSGTVNIVTRRPREAEKEVQFEAGNFGERRASAYLGGPTSVGALSLSLDWRQHDAVDGVGSGISQYAGFERKNAGLAYFLDDVAGFRLRGRLDVLEETRGGGALGDDYDAIEVDTVGNPFNFSAGPHGSPDPGGWVAPDGVSGTATLAGGQNGFLYNDGRAGLSQIITTRRQQGTLIAERRFGESTLRLAAGLARHHQNSFYGGDALYRAEQNQYYLESSWRTPWGDKLLTVGADYRFEDLASEGYSFATASTNNGLDNYSYRTPGAFAQLYAPLLENRLEANASVRMDKHNVFGNIVSPRVNLLYHHTDAWSSRVSMGRGYRAPTSFFEQDHGILGDSRIVRNISAPEKSDNLSYARSFSSDRFSWTASADWTRIRNMARLTPGQPDPNGGPLTVTIFDSAPDPLIVRGLDWVGTWQATAATALTLGLEKFSYTFTPGTLSFARPEERIYLTLDSDFGPWDLTAKLTWTGPQNLARFFDYAGTPRYNLDGTPKPDWSPSFTMLDLRGQYRFNKRYSAFMGVNNLFDYRQAQHDSYLWVDSAGSLDVTQIWGPNIGRQIYAGIKVNL